VQVVDSSKIRTQSGLAFVGSFGISAVAGVASSCVLWNPAGSGKNVYIERVRVSLTAASTYGAEHISALGGGLTQDAATIVPKKIGSVAATQGWKTTAASFAGVSQPFNSIFTALLGANAIDVGDLYEPVLIVPGSGFRIFCGTVNVGMIASAEFFEEAI
jgi:hypothetical protein